ncbi:MAG: cytochrome P460 family protein [Alphaproteobacteria bacterium]|nr:cytochrome P460 family protein [Alphaproteobacteria bacterium]
MELTDSEAAKAYDCLQREMQAAYAKAAVKAVANYGKWKRFNTGAYQSATHGSRYVNNYANKTGQKAYGKYEKIGKMAKGGVLAKDSFQAMPDGRLAVGPLFVMEKMGKGFNKESRDWRYSMIMPDGSVFGTTGGAGASKVKFCYECHNAMGEESDSLTFLPEEYRSK